MPVHKERRRGRGSVRTAERIPVDDRFEGHQVLCDLAPPGGVGLGEDGEAQVFPLGEELIGGGGIGGLRCGGPLGQGVTNALPGLDGKRRQGGGAGRRAARRRGCP
ncbi:hypothetical protein ADL28_43370 [Streptomyces violaceusniger]|uniref:Uncharacterized protein n=2 Tax=Streptomyces violaceusniger group TaxID=2839105 RepID=A0ABD5J858_9ACTN|nr:hypothetical protein [Streptomyces violaceusniger]KUL43234.1 hypothetical protein ADL28_43370 [Streptomyces violaceusniger]MEE4584557.1 hypothetical protein [Streptomyces sp. DSM 41602]